MNIISYIDSALHLNSTDSGVIKFSSEFPGFEGHFPGNPIVPGACLIETARQLVSKIKGKDLSLLSIHKVKFVAPVIPGDELEFKLQFVNSTRINVTVISGNVRICDLQIEVG
jgi:3-hydroxyacyl-[acyl-carrier-protein] dehydratase